MNSPTLLQLGELLTQRGRRCTIRDISDRDPAIRDLSIDSREVAPGTLFCALRGTKSDGNAFAAEAVANGAVAIMSDKISDAEIPQILVDDVQGALALSARLLFQSRVENKISVAVTGTNGKTSVAYLLAQAFAALRGESVYAGTLGLAHLGAERAAGSFSDTKTTTPTSIELHRFIGGAPKVSAFAVEMASHALHQRRLEELEFDLAIFMNLTRDHLDYHGSMEEYYQQKKLLFTRDLAGSGKKRRLALVNISDPFGERLAAELRQSGELDVRTFSAAGNPGAAGSVCQVTLEKVLLNPGGTELELRIEGKESISIRSALLGRYNSENLTAVAGALNALGFSSAEISGAVSAARPVPGRLEPVTEGNALPTALVDYAHTPDALEKAIGSIRELTGGRVITVFGCGGDRDRGKRPMMGEIASRLSDRVFVTSDNPRTEEPGRIISEILEGIPPERQAAASTEPDRRKAINQAIGAAGAGDLVLIAGKGHEPYQEVNGVRYEFSDCEVARQALRSLAIP